MIHLYREKSTTQWSVCLAYLLLAASLTVLFWKDKFAGYTFGFEYGNVAEALASGKGFSDPFGKGTGLTAWCPPFYVFIQFVVFKIFGIKTVAAFWTILFFRVLLMTITLFLILNIKYSDSIKTYRILLLPIFLLYSVFVLQREFDDKALNIFLSALVIFVVSETIRHQKPRLKYVMIFLAFILPISNISLFIGCFILLCSVIIYNIFKPNSIMSSRSAIGLLCIMAISIAAWGFRNKAAIGKFIPFKSNLWFEIYLSNVTDYDGIIRQSNWLLYHPMSNKVAQEAYRKKGEIAFLEYYRTVSTNYLLENRLDYIRKTLNRALNVFFFVSSSNDYEPVATETIKPVDLLVLEKHNLILNNNWHCLERPDEAFEKYILSIGLENPMAVLTDWRNKKEIMENRIFKSPAARLGGFVSALVPALALLIGLFIREIRNSDVFRVSIFFFLLSVAPYIIFSHYFRYQTFQFGYFSIFIFLASASVISRFFRKNKYPSAT